MFYVACRMPIKRDRLHSHRSVSESTAALRFYGNVAYPGYLPIPANIKKCRSRAAFPYICGRKMSHSFADRNEVLSMHGTDPPPSSRLINNSPPPLA